MPADALIVVDVQNDFMPGGPLATHGGDEVVPVINGLIDQFDLVVATQDWHPPDHGSFASNHEGQEVGDVIDLDGLDQILWPDHCVQQTEGAEFVDELHIDAVDEVFRKGTDPEIDSYSGFYDNGHRKATGMAAFLEDQGVKRIYVAGVATDYCVKYTVLDGCKLDLQTWVVLDGCRGVGQAAEDIDQAYGDMRAAGAQLIESGVLAAHRKA